MNSSTKRPQMSSGFDIFVANAQESKRIKPEKEDAEQNLENFKKIYNDLKQAPPDSLSCKIQLNVESKCHTDTIVLVNKFLHEIEKWPMNKINVRTTDKYLITVDFCLAGVYWF
jgi:hypothetical protein